VPEQTGDPRPPSRGLGSVAEETARLLDALLGPAPATSPGEAADDHVQDPDDHVQDPDDHPDNRCPTCGHDPRTGSPADTSAADTSLAGGPAEVCHLCPVCQVLRVVRSVRPETLDRLADLAAAVTESLRDAAAERWRSAGATDDATGSPVPPRPRVQDIVVADDDDGLDETEDSEDAQDIDETKDIMIVEEGR